jgi:hypothetical protein
MSSPAPDDLAGGPTREPVHPPRWLGAVALATLACVGCWVLLTHDEPSTPAGPAPAPSSPSAVAAQPAFALGSDPGLLGVRAVCVRSDRHRVLWLGVDLVNGRLARTTLLSVTPIGSAAASTATGAVLPAGRTCDRKPRVGDSLVMRPGGIVPLRLRLPGSDHCRAAPISVLVDVAFLGPGERPATQRLDLHPDPGEVDVLACRGT